MISKIKKYLFIFIGILIIFIIFSIILFIVKIFLGLPEEKFKETIIAGIFQSIISSFILYFIFSEIFVKKPKVRLYVEPNTISKGTSEFVLKFYLNNTGDFVARNIILTMQFNDFKEMKIIDGRFKDISEHRSNVPSVQFTKESGVLHAYPKIRNTYIGRIWFRIEDMKNEVKISYDIVAEQMDFLRDTVAIKISG